MKRKLLFAALCVVSALGFKANAQFIMETDLTAQFESLTKKENWIGASGYVTWAAPQVTTNSGKTVACCERYNGDCKSTGDVFYSTVTGLAPGTYTIELYGAAAFTFGRGFGSEAFTGDLSVDRNDAAYSENDKIEAPGTGVELYAESEGVTYGGEIPICYATNFNTTGVATVKIENVEVGASGEIKIGMNKESQSTNWHVIQLKSVIATVDGDEMLETLRGNAQDLLNDDLYAYVLGDVRDDLEAACEVEPAEQTSDAYMAVANGITDAMAAFKDALFCTYEGTAYLMNSEAEQFVAAGFNWGTQACLQEGYGLDFTFEPNLETNRVTIETQVYYENRHYLGSNLYVDQDPSEFALVYRGENYYYISDGNGKFVNVDDDGLLVYSEDPCEWVFLTQEDLEAQRKEATTTNPVEVTWMVKGANFSRNDKRVDAWTVSEDCTNKNLSGGNNTNNCAESFHSTFTISQTLEGAPSGYYELSAQGFYRQDKKKENDVETEIEEEAPVFFIKYDDGHEETVAFPVRSGEENSMGAASESFTKGEYTIEPFGFYLADGQKLTVGVRGTAKWQWVIFDNFRLYYSGYMIDEDADYVAAANKDVTVQIKRTIKEGLNTLVLPFDMTQDEVEETFGLGSKVYNVGAYNAEKGTITFKEVSGITANKPCVLEAADAGEEFTIEERTIEASKPVATVGALSFIGSYDASYQVEANKGNYVLGGGKIWEVNSTDDRTKMKGTRAYFHIEGASNAKSLDIIFDEDDDAATAIAGINSNKAGKGAVYNVAGQRVDENFKGFVIKSGKKLFVK